MVKQTLWGAIATSRARRSALAGCASVLALASHGFAQAQQAPVLPTGGQVMAGVASIGAPSGGALVINQTSARAIIDWQSFSIGAGGRVDFNNGSGATLSRVTGGNPSSIAGQLNATGSLYLINPAGIVVDGAGKVVAGGSFVASTLDVTDPAFMAGGAQTFVGSSGGDVTNNGAIQAGGDAVLIGYSTSNAGSITAGGTASLATGTRVTMRLAGADARISVEGAGGDSANSGAITGAMAELRAAGGNVYALAGDSGLIRATGASTRAGHVWLTAANGSVFNDGAISAEGGAVDIAAAGIASTSGRIDVSGGVGGAVTVRADQILNQSVIDASGRAGRGGAVTLGFTSNYVSSLGSTIRADAASGAAGAVAVTGAAGSRLFNSGAIEGGPGSRRGPG